ncbi:MAG: cytochrome c [Calditrichaeota bacterium]|nr:cytochrome c [Candidatus Cloacimonadota bacterium]MCA9786616.1 cytochrome c [Candidatus Cloacimonadota bacterium]MCB1046257.1 cytochrome c [Calditrichota bacterium]MCB9473546.1 cytochrome c [Candidatus Delongbacteria bacterium]
MLSKSQAKLFFFGGTALFSLVFLGLTVDTIRQTPARSMETTLDESALRGRMIWDEKNCMGCHTILGEGAYYAPELTKVIERRDEAWVRGFLQNPQGFYPGRRKMVQYDFTDQEITDLVAFLTWIGTVDTNGFPFDPPLREASQRAIRQEELRREREGK